MKFIRISLKVEGRWKELDNGPFPITAEQLNQARAEFSKEFEQAKPLTGARISPQTAARSILKMVAPHLSSFDNMMLGFAVTNPQVRIEHDS